MRKIVFGIVAALSIVLASTSDAKAQLIGARVAARSYLNNWSPYLGGGYYGTGLYSSAYASPYYGSGYYYPSYSGYYDSSYSMPGSYGSGYYNSGYYYPSYYNSGYYNGYYGGWYPGSNYIDSYAPRASAIIRGGRYWR
jgi:hypothetical protein